MLQRADLLLTTAQIGMALAGFAGLVTLLRRPGPRTDVQLNEIRFRSMMELSLTLVAFALLPFVPAGLGLSETSSWRGTSAIYSLAALAFFAHSLRRNRGTMGRVLIAGGVTAALLAVCAALSLVLARAGRVHPARTGCLLCGAVPPLPGGGVLLHPPAVRCTDAGVTERRLDSTRSKRKHPMIRGSCLCGSVRFEYARAVTQVGLCHCSLCRKVSGTGSNAVIVVPETDFTWTAGEDLRRVYVKPSGWKTTFCERCGSPLPQSIRGSAAYWVPAGVLDDDPGLRIGGHIYVGSKAAWDEIASGAPQFEAGPIAPAGSR